MIEIRAVPRDDGLMLSAKGHAGMASFGQDVVCAGVSALLYGFAAYLESLNPCEETGASHLECVEGEGLLQLATRGLGGADLRGWAVVAEGLRLIEKAYPTCVRLWDEYSSPQQTIMEEKSEHDG